jgi:O-antigen/teichoic acid export membrane protein
MRIGRTSIVHFGSELLAAVVGFVATVYFARVLGASTLGVYFLVVAVYTWAKMFGTTALRQSMMKRLSEGTRPDERFTAGVVVQAALFVVIALLLFAFADVVEGYVGIDVALALVVLVFGGVCFAFVSAVLRGEKLVHVAALLKPVERLFRTLLQVGFVLANFAVFGLVYGHIVALVLAALVGLYFVSARLSMPEREDFENLLSFAKYSWLGGVRTRSFNAMDTLVLGVFVSTTLVGVYEIAWNLASILGVFSTSVSQAVFPEISDLSASDEREEAASLVNDALAFTGLFTIPGLVGGLVLGEFVLGIYGSEFRQGHVVLAVLITARLLAAYQRQFIDALSAFDRPDLAFRINAAFIVVNVALNVALVAQYGWIGAAVATTVSAAITLVLSYRSARSLIGVTVPYGEIGRQVLAALVMGAVIYGATLPLAMSIPVALVLVGVGAGVYFLALLGLSTRFRTTVVANLPV